MKHDKDNAPTCLRSVLLGGLAGLLVVAAVWALQAGVLVVRPVGEVLIWGALALVFLIGAAWVLKGR